MRHKLSFLAAVLLLTSAVAVASRAADGMRFDLLPGDEPAAAASQAEECLVVTELNLLPSLGSGWFALLDTAVRGLCDLNVFPDPRLYKLTKTAGDTGLGFSGTAASGAAITIEVESSRRLAVTETLKDGKPVRLVSRVPIASPWKTGPLAFVASADAAAGPKPVTLCLDRNLASGQLLAWLLSADAKTCTDRIPARLYLLRRQEAEGGDTGYAGLWVTEAGVYRLEIGMGTKGPSRVTETSPSGESLIWDAD